MIDFKAMESYLETREKKQIFISPETELKKNDMLKLQELANKYTKINIASCIRTKENKKGSFEKDFYIKGVIICPKCKNERKEDFTKTSLMNYLKDYERDLYICVECKEIKRKEAERQYLAKLALDSDKEATNIYIKNYLTSEKSWKRDLSNYKKMKILRNYGINIHTVAKHIQSLSYYDFLSTPY